MKNTLADFGKNNFNKKMMKERLPYPIYLKWKDAVRLKEDLDSQTADAIAHAMKEWALERGATHYTHWFQPLNGLTAKKNESFLDRTSDQEPIVRFSGKELIKSEPDASSFPSGGIRSTFEARGYTYWDSTANSFIIDNILYIPSIFVSYNGEKLDKRGPILDSMNRVSDEGTRVVNLFEKDEPTYRMRVKVGLEQEFFLVDKKLYDRRSDLKHVGRTIFGAKPPKAQELGDHYFGVIPARVEKFYEEVNEVLWSLGIYAKTEHNEAAPCQFETAILFENCNISVDDNQLCMAVLKSVALKHGMVCLLHEKPFVDVNGSGKHNNYSIATNYGLNCFSPGKNPRENFVFLLFTSALIKTVDIGATLIRIASSSPGNDYRLGGHEAPPGIISIFLGDDLEDVFKSIAYDDYEQREFPDRLKVQRLGYVQRDRSDRNRTSPVAFTGNKFEFRMLGSSKSAADINVVINILMAHELKNMANVLEPLAGDEKALKEKAYELVKDIILKHGRVLYAGDGYADEWMQEAEKRGLPNYRKLIDAVVGVQNDPAAKILVEEKVLTDIELSAIYDIILEEIIISHQLEARTFISMINKDIVPSALSEVRDLNEVLKDVEIPSIKKKRDTLVRGIEKLEEIRELVGERYRESSKCTTHLDAALFLQNKVMSQFEEARKVADSLEEITSRKNYSLPTYEDLFNSLI